MSERWAEVVLVFIVLLFVPTCSDGGCEPSVAVRLVEALK